jgi:folate-binding protein YgfZ
MIADLRIHHRGDHLLVDVPPGTAAALAARLDQLVFTEDVRVADVSAATAQIGLVGPASARVAAEAFGVDAAAAAGLDVGAHLTAAGITLARGDETSDPFYEIFADASAKADVIARLAAHGAVPISAALMESLRIDAGRPAFGADMTAETIPLEAGLLDRAISTTKGCYVGQEVIIRVLHRGGGRIARRLVKLVLDSSVTEPPAAGTALFSNGRDVGRLTSAAPSPREPRIIALGYVSRGVAEAGGHVGVAIDEHTVPATIVSLAG